MVVVEPRDSQQLVVYEMLSRADGAPVTYAELHDAGIEFPASVVAELELAGVAVERRDVDTPGARRLRGVRLDPKHDRSGGVRGKQLPGGEPPPLAVRPLATAGGSRRALSGRARARWAIGALTAAAMAAAVAAFVPGHPGPRAATPPRARVRASASASRPAHAAPRPRGASPRGRVRHRTPPQPLTARAPAARPSAAQAVTLDLRGHGLVLSGRYDQAIAVLQQALSATGERLAGCREPVTAACLTYAYALFDLGRALRLSGHPGASVTILRSRLQIDNQRPVVALELARAEAATTRHSGSRGSPTPVV